VPLTGVTVSDEMLQDAVPPVMTDCAAQAPDTLAPGANFTCKSDQYLATSDDVTNGIDNTAVAHGTPPANSDGSQPNDVTSTGEVNVPVARIAIAKSADPLVVAKAGDPITYTFTVINQGTVDLTDVSVDDPMLDAAGLTVTCDATSLAAGDSMDCKASGTYGTTSGDIAAGQIQNTATVTGTPPANPDGSAATPVTADDSATVLIGPAPALELTKTADPTVLPYTAKVGDIVTYTFTVKNTGEGTAYNVAINDPMFTNVKCDSTTLAPNGGMTTCTATYAVQQKDLNAGSFTNTAKATGWNDPTCTSADAPGCIQAMSSAASAAVTGTPHLKLVKLVDKTTVVATETATYTYVVTNDGSAPAYNLAIQEQAFTGSGTASAVSCSSTTLLPGQVTKCTNTYVMTAADVLSGKPLTNTAQAFASTDKVWNAWDVSSNQSSASINPPAPVSASVTGGSVSGGLVLWPMFALVVTAAGIGLLNWRRKLAV